MPVKKVRGGYKVVSYVTGKPLKRVYKSKKAAENAAATSKRRSMRKRSTRSRRARNSRRRMY
jgi:ribonuclease PH